MNYDPTYDLQNREDSPVNDKPTEKDPLDIIKEALDSEDFVVERDTHESKLSDLLLVGMIDGDEDLELLIHDSGEIHLMFRFRFAYEFKKFRKPEHVTEELVKAMFVYGEYILNR